MAKKNSDGVAKNSDDVAKKDGRSTKMAKISGDVAKKTQVAWQNNNEMETESKA